MKAEQKTSVVLPNFKRINLVEMVFDALKEHILSGKFQGGERLPTQEILAQQFGVSRTVMREALNKLSSLGLIESQQGRGTFVGSSDARTMMGAVFHGLVLDDKSICELMEVRYYLERMIVRLAAKRIDPPQIESLQKNVLAMEHAVNAGDLERFAETDLLFHLQLAEISRNSIFRQLLETLRGMISKFFEGFRHTPGIAERSVAYHKRIFAAVAKKNPDRAEYEMQQHLLDVIDELQQKYELNLEL